MVLTQWTTRFSPQADGGILSATQAQGWKSEWHQSCMSVLVSQSEIQISGSWVTPGSSVSHYVSPALSPLTSINPFPALVMTSSDIHGETFPISQRVNDIIGRPAPVLVVPACSGVADFLKMNISGWLLKSVGARLFFDSCTSSACPLAQKGLTWSCQWLQGKPYTVTGKLITVSGVNYVKFSILWVMPQKVWQMLQWKS